MLEFLHDALLAPFEPDPDRMLETLRISVDDAMLEDMAQLDCGDHNAASQFAALAYIRNTGCVQAPMEWEPQESLELTRYCVLDVATELSSQQRRREHQMRAFACAALLRAEAEPANQDGRLYALCSDLALLLESARVLGPEAEAGVASYAAWRITQLPEPEEGPFFMFALLLLAVLSSNWDRADSWIVELCERVIAVENADRVALAKQRWLTSDEWLLGLTSFGPVGESEWRDLNASLGEAAFAMPKGAARQHLVGVVARIAPST